MKRQLASLILTTLALAAIPAQATELPPTINIREAVIAELDADLPVVVVVDQAAHQTHVLQMQNDQLCHVFAIPNATGKPSTPTPNCRARITQKELDPAWTPPRSIDPNQKVVPPYKKTKKNPLGLANLRLNVDHGMIALHGTNEPKQIGQSVSHGCIRHLNEDILSLYKIVHVGTPVYIVPNTEEANIPISEFGTTGIARNVVIAR
jgi:lipoprotein-anchoring transpeptidase ErfK/SrfK